MSHQPSLELSRHGPNRAKIPAGRLMERLDCTATCCDAKQRAHLQVGANQAPSNVNNLTAVLFLWTILPGYAAASYMPTIVLERPLFVRCAKTRTAQRALPLTACPLFDTGRTQSMRDGWELCEAAAKQWCSCSPRRLCVRETVTECARAGSAMMGCTGRAPTCCSRWWRR